jgi:hypothetical protein
MACRLQQLDIPHDAREPRHSVSIHEESCARSHTYIMKYISKPEDSLHLQLAIAAVVRKDMKVANMNGAVDFDLEKSFLVKTYNKLISHREVGLPEMISHLLDLPNHYTSASFRKVHTTQLLKYMTQAYDGDPSNHPTTVPDYSELENDPRSLDAPVSNHNLPNVDSPLEHALQSEIVVSKGQFVLISKFDDYALRGDDLAECCLYDYSSLFYKKKAQSDGFVFDDSTTVTNSSLLTLQFLLF